MVEFSQRLNIFYATLFMYTKEWDNLNACLKLILKNTALNVGYLLEHDEFADCLNEEGKLSFHYPGSDKYITLDWFAKEFLPNYESTKMIADAYGKYLVYLQEKDRSVYSDKVLDLLTASAEKEFIRLCDSVLEQIDDSIEYGGEPEEIYKDDKDRFSRMLQNVKKGSLRDIVGTINLDINSFYVPF